MSTRLKPRRAIIFSAAVAAGQMLITTSPGAAQPDPGPTAAAEVAAQYTVIGPRTFADRDAIARTGAAIDYIGLVIRPEPRSTTRAPTRLRYVSGADRCARTALPAAAGCAGAI